MLSQPSIPVIIPYEDCKPRNGRWVCGSIRRNREALTGIFMAHAIPLANFIISSSRSFSLQQQVPRAERQARLDQTFNTVLDVIETLCDGIGWTSVPRSNAQAPKPLMSAHDLEEHPEIRGSCLTRTAKKILDSKDRGENRDLPAEEIARHWRELLASRDRKCPLPVSPPSFANDMTDSPFSDAAYVADIIRRMPNGKAVGPDRMPAELLKVCPDVNAIWVRPLWNLCWQEGMVPSIWRLAFLHPIHKDGDRRCGGNYRGISLMSHMRKSYEYVLKIKLEALVGPRSRYQHGFVNGRSIWGPIWGLHNELQDDLRDPRNGRPSALFVDIAKAYDTVDRNILWRKLRERSLAGGDPRIIDQLRELGDGNILLVRGNDEGIHPVIVERGLPQGSSLSPVLYSYFIDDLPEALSLRPNATVKLYADDIAIKPSTPDPKELQEYCNRLSDYADDHGFSVNVKKTVLVGGEGVLIRQQAVTPVASARYLGIMFNAHGGQFQQTQKGALENARRTLRKLREKGLMAEKIGAARRLILVKTFVLSRLDFGAGLPMRVTLLREMQQFYEGTIKTALTGDRFQLSGWGLNLLATTGLEPFPMRREVAALRYAFLSFSVGVPWDDCALLLVGNCLWQADEPPGLPPNTWERREELRKDIQRRRKDWTKKRTWYRPVGVQSPIWEHEFSDWIQDGWIAAMLHREEHKRDWRCIAGLTGTLGYRKRERELWPNMLAPLEALCRTFAPTPPVMGDV